MPTAQFLCQFPGMFLCTTKDLHNILTGIF